MKINDIIAENSFVLGLNIRDLPLKGEAMDRLAYNAGLRINRAEKEFGDYRQGSSGLVSFFELVKDNGSDISKGARENIKENLETVNVMYEDFFRLVKLVPQFKHHTDEIKKRVFDSYQSLQERTREVLE